MAFNVEELREVIKINHDDVVNNRMLTNELLVDDIMVELGYNKKKDKTVKRMYSGALDWQVVETTGSRIAVKVFAPGEKMSDEELLESMNKAASSRFSIFIVTNGEALTVCRFNKETGEYREVCDIDFQTELDERSELVLKYISKESFSLTEIDDILAKSSLTQDQIKEALLLSIDSLVSELCKQLNSEDTNTCKELLLNMINNPAEVSESSASIAGDDAGQIGLQPGQTIIDESELDSLQRQINNLSIEKQGYLTQISEQQEQIEELEKQLEDTSLQQADSSESTSVNTEEIEELQSKLQEKQQAIETLQDKVGELQTELTSEQDKNTELQDKVEELQSHKEAQAIPLDGDISKEIAEYRTTIEELNLKLSNANEEIAGYKARLNEASSKLDSMSGAERKKALELLDVIGDSPELNRSYVGVINTELVQYEDIHTFAGRCLQELYKIKSFDASRYIFDGDIFTLNTNPVRNDLMMNNKAYDLEFDGEHEDEILNKLRVLFSHYSDIVFECKKIGTATGSSNGIIVDNNKSTENNSLYEQNETEAVEQDDYEETDYEQDGYEETDYEESETEDFITDEDDNDTDFDNLENDEDDDFTSSEDAFGTSDDEWDSLEELDDDSELDNEDEDDEGESTELLLVSQLASIDNLIWSEEDIDFYNIKYIGSNDRVFDINKENEDTSYEELLCTALNAVLALAQYSGDLKVIERLKQLDMSTVNNYLHPYTEEYAKYPRLVSTKYVVADLDSIQQVASILFDIASALNINMSEMFVYFDAETESEHILNNYSIDESTIELNDFTTFNYTENFTPGQAVIKGSFTSLITMTKNSLVAHKMVFTVPTVVKTKYLQVALDSDDSLQEVVRQMIIEASNSGRVNYKAVGNVIGENYRIISENPSECGDNPVEIQLSGSSIYLARLEGWQIIHSLIRIHTIFFSNLGIAIKTQINVDALNFYANEFETSDPSLALAVRSFIDYVASCISTK